MTHLKRTSSHYAVDLIEQGYNELCTAMVINEGKMHILHSIEHPDARFNILLTPQDPLRSYIDPVML